MVTIFIFSATPGDDLPSFGLVDLLVKKGGHMLGYFLLALAGLRGFSNRKRAPLLAFALALAYALTDEAHQMFTPGRHPALTDVAIDAAGASIGLLAAWKWEQLRGWLKTGL
jgi:VanZ family protein